MRFVVSWGLTAALGVMGLVGAMTIACGGGGSGDADQVVDVATNPGGGGAQASPTTGGGGGGGTQTIKVSMKDNLFDPKDLKVKAGQTYIIEAKNDGQAIHNVHVLSKAAGESKDFTGALTVAAGATDKIQVTFTKKGTVKFQCDFHVPDMVGTITVE